MSRSGLIAHVVIVAAPEDIHALSVQRRVRDLGAECDIVSLRSLVDSPFVAPIDTRVRTNVGGVALRSHTAVWWRRAEYPRVGPSVADHPARRFAEDEWWAAAQGIFGSLKNCVVNDPFLQERAAHKVYQLRAASACGLHIPATVITNDAATARNFFDANQERGMRTIYKPLTAPHQKLGQAVILTDPADLDGIQHAPVIFQECIERGHDVRVAVVGRRVFASTISFTGESEDWRVGRDISYSPSSLNPELEARLIKFMACTGLVAGSFDLRIDPAGRPVFLEVNPSGQFLFLELKAGLPISQAYAAHLVQFSRDQMT